MLVFLYADDHFHEGSVFDHEGLRRLDDPNVPCKGEVLEHVDRTDITATVKSIRALRIDGTFPQDVHGSLSV